MNSTPPRRAAWLPVAAGAMLLAAFGVAYAMGGFNRTGRIPAGPITLEDTVAALREAHPEWFGSFEMLDAKFLNAYTTIGGGGFRDRPHHTVATLRPAFLWSAPDGSIERYEVTLYDGEGQKLWTRQTRRSPLAFPDDESALTPDSSYTWEVTSMGSVTFHLSRHEFTVISHESRDRFAAALEAVRSGPQAHQAVVLAHVAIRMGLLQDAMDLLAPLAQADDADPLVKKTYTYLMHQ